MLIYLIFKIVEFSRVQQSFGHALNQFHFKTIGTEQTEDEQRISKYIRVYMYMYNVLMSMYLYV